MADAVRLAELGPDDEHELLAGVAASRALHEPFVYPPCDREAFRAYLEAPGENALYAVRRHDDGALVGVVTLREIGGAPRRASLGFYALVPWQSRGYLREGIGRALDAAFSRHRVARVCADVQPGNAAAWRLLTRLGFALDGSAQRALHLGSAWRAHERLVLDARRPS